MVERGLDAVVAHSELDFRAPARYDDVLALPARIQSIGRTAITTEIDVMRGDELLVAMRARHVCVSTDTWQKTEVPEWVRAGLERFLVA
jgi:acyl-CoA thioester hydrolase